MALVNNPATTWTEGGSVGISSFAKVGFAVEAVSIDWKTPRPSGRFLTLKSSFIGWKAEKTM